MVAHQSKTAFLPAALLTGLLALFASEACRAQAPAKLPPDLDLVPRDAACFIHVHTADVWKSEWLGDLRRLVGKAGQPSLQVFLQKFAPDLTTVDRLTFVMATPKALGEPIPSGEPEGMSALLVVHTSKPYDRLRVIEALGPREKLYKRNLYYFNEDLWSGLALIDNQTMVFGSEDALVRFFDENRERGAAGPLQSALQEAAGTHHAVIGLNPQLLAKEPGVGLVPPPVQKLLEARCATWSFDLDKETRLALRLDYAKEDDAKAGEKALKDTLEMARAALTQPIDELEKMLKKPAERAPLAELPENFGQLVALGFLREMDGLLKDAPIQRQGASVLMPIKYKGLDSGNAMVASMAAITLIGTRANQTFLTVGAELSGTGKDPSEQHLKKLADALDKYHKEKGSYPPAAIYDRDGRPLLSWRVALLPYLGEDALYKEFKLDEPWDSLHNKKLLKRLPAALKAPNIYERYKSCDLVFTGTGTFFPGKKGAKNTDAPATAALLVLADADKAVYWSKPVDLPYADDQPLPELFGKNSFNNVRVIQADGKVRSFRKTEMDEKALRALIKGK
jgi:Protein of unknown function (DUF1559)